jgi:UDP-N-acetylmuramoyl-tripeptide--D-alanyl-D-alanine ligase
MNNAGEIAALTRQVRPHVAVITAIAPAHIENLGSEEAIADAKGEIFAGLEPGGVAIIRNDTPHRDRLVKAARRHAERIITFGSGDADIHAMHAVRSEDGGSLISAVLLERELTFTIAHRGDHWVSNALAVLAAVEAVGADVALAGLALADMAALQGRGARHNVRVNGGALLLIDESYNANPGVDGGDLEEPLGRDGIDGASRCSADARSGRAQRCAARRTGARDHRREGRPLILIGEENAAAGRRASSARSGSILSRCR